MDLTDNHPEAKRKGILALQLHAGAPMTVEFKDIRLRQLKGKDAQAAIDAGKLALAFRARGLKAWEKSKGDPVSEADLAADNLLQGRLKPARKAYGWLSEETVDDNSRLKAQRSFVVDPIDGTKGFVRVIRIAVLSRFSGTWHLSWKEAV